MINIKQTRKIFALTGKKQISVRVPKTETLRKCVLKVIVKVFEMIEKLLWTTILMNQKC